MIAGYPHGAEGITKDKLTGMYCRGEFEATACVEKLAEYEDIGTVEQFKIAMDRLTEKKPYIQSDGHGETEINCCECPNCDSFIGYEEECRSEINRYDFCPNCGQAFDWRDYE